MLQDVSGRVVRTERKCALQAPRMDLAAPPPQGVPLAPRGARLVPSVWRWWRRVIKKARQSAGLLFLQVRKEGLILLPTGAHSLHARWRPPCRGLGSGTKSLACCKLKSTWLRLGVAPDADALLVEDVERDVSQDGMGTHGHTVFRGGQEGDTQFSFVPCDVTAGAVVAAGVPPTEAVALGKVRGIAPRPAESNDRTATKGKALTDGS